MNTDETGNKRYVMPVNGDIHKAVSPPPFRLSPGRACSSYRSCWQLPIFRGFREFRESRKQEDSPSLQEQTVKTGA